VCQRKAIAKLNICALLSITGLFAGSALVWFFVLMCLLTTYCSSPIPIIRLFRCVLLLAWCKASRELQLSLSCSWRQRTASPHFQQKVKSRAWHVIAESKPNSATTQLACQRSRSQPRITRWAGHCNGGKLVNEIQKVALITLRWAHMLKSRGYDAFAEVQRS